MKLFDEIKNKFFRRKEKPTAVSEEKPTAGYSLSSFSEKEFFWNRKRGASVDLITKALTKVIERETKDKKKSADPITINNDATLKNVTSADFRFDVEQIANSMSTPTTFNQALGNIKSKFGETLQVQALDYYNKLQRKEFLSVTRSKLAKKTGIELPNPRFEENADLPPKEQSGVVKADLLAQQIIQQKKQNEGKRS